MKAAVYRTYGAPNVVTIADVAKPTPESNEVLIRIVATTVTTGDWRARSLDLPPGFGALGRLVFGVFGPRQPVLGTECAGVIEAVGAAVTRFAVGDEVLAFTGGKYGCHAEYRVMAEDGLIALKPANVSFEQAAALSFGGTTALDRLKANANVKPGERVLIVGASGGVGTAAVQIAKHLGAEVTAVCSAANASLVRSLGADKIIDYRTKDFATTGESWDVILDTTGTVPLSRCEHALKPGGRLVIVLNTSLGQAMGVERAAKGSGKRVIAGVVKVRPEDIRYLAELAAAGAYRPVIDRSYPLDDIAQAHAYVDTGRKRGSVVVTVWDAEAVALAA